MNDYADYYCTNSIDDVTFDDRFTELDLEQKIEFYKENNLLSTLQSIPGYPLAGISEINVGLYHRYYIGWKPNCNKRELLNTPEILRAYTAKPKLMIIFNLIVLIRSSFLIFRFFVIKDVFPSLKKILDSIIMLITFLLNYYKCLY